MCGIIGYVGSQDAGQVVLEGLKRLEYRGYDSAGIAVIASNGKIELRRSVGKIANLEKLLQKEPVVGYTALGHTRWATHGRPSEENAHPLTDCKSQLVVVLNGIIENFASLKKQLAHEKHIFRSETDSEVVAHLIEKHLQGRMEWPALVEAVRKALEEIQGAYALGVLSALHPEMLIGARKLCPLVIGLAEEEKFLASDVPPFLSSTRSAVFLEDEEMALITPKQYTIWNLKGQKVQRNPVHLPWDLVMAEKAGYKHFMLKEIHEQPQSVEDTLRGRLRPEQGAVSPEEIGVDQKVLQETERVALLGCGTAYYAGLVGRFLIEELAGIPCEVEIASEFRYRNPVITSKVLVIAISQSGETMDTLAALREAKAKGAQTLGICNCVGSTLTREASATLYTHCGPEIGVASTKAFLGQLTALYLIALALGKARGRLSEEASREFVEELLRIPGKIRAVLKKDREIQQIAQRFFKCASFLYIGRHLNYPIALEGALKLKEISYIHAEGYPAGEMKHGPIALIDSMMPVVAIATQSRVQEKVLSNMEEVKARGGILIGITTQGDEKVHKKADHVLEVPEIKEWFAPFVTVVPLQLLAYHIAVLRGCDVDQPRNLAKSVTVE